MKKTVTYTILFLSIILFWCSANIRYGKENWRSLIDSDGKGYYSYLPAIFIYHDLNFGFFDTINEQYFKNRPQDYRNVYKGKHIDKYYCGTAVVLSPFYFLGHTLSIINDQPLDGYSKYYCITINLAALCYTILGCLFLARWLRLYNITEINIALTLLLFVFGTNIYYYVVVEPSMSHLYSFFFVSLFIYYSSKWYHKPSAKNLVLIGFALAMITLIRPINIIIVLFMPFLAGNWEKYIQGFKNLLSFKLALIVACIIFTFIVSIQLIIYKIQTGDFIIYSYSQEGFHWTQPNMINLLFSYKKGLFLYTPILFISLVGLLVFYKKNKFQFYSYVGFFLFLCYLLSCWWCWWYGGSFGMRAFIEYYFLFILPFAVTLESIGNHWIKKSYLTVAFLLLMVCQIQTYQARYYYIHYEEMTKEQYWRVFLRIDWVIKGTHHQPTNIPANN